MQIYTFQEREQEMELSRLLNLLLDEYSSEGVGAAGEDRNASYLQQLARIVEETVGIHQKQGTTCSFPRTRISSHKS